MDSWTAHTCTVLEVGYAQRSTRLVTTAVSCLAWTPCQAVTSSATVSSLSRLNKTILAHYSRFNKIATLGYIMAHEGMGTDHYSMSRLTMRRSPSSTGYCYILPVDEL